MKQEQRWSFMQQPEQRRFILFYGILLFGLPFALLLSITEYYSKYGATGSQIGQYLSHAWFWIMFRCLFCGILMGFSLWHIKQRDVRK
jgi:hypothetical protein